MILEEEWGASINILLIQRGGIFRGVLEYRDLMLLKQFLATQEYTALAKTQMYSLQIN